MVLFFIRSANVVLVTRLCILVKKRNGSIKGIQRICETISRWYFTVVRVFQFKIFHLMVTLEPPVKLASSIVTFCKWVMKFKCMRLSSRHVSTYLISP